MESKLTLYIEQELIEQAQAYAHKHDKTLSQLVSDYLSALIVKRSEENETDLELAPITASLLGLCSDLNFADDAQLREEYIDYLESKHR